MRNRAGHRNARLRSTWMATHPLALSVSLSLQSLFSLWSLPSFVHRTSSQAMSKVRRTKMLLRGGTALYMIGLFLLCVTDHSEYAEVGQLGDIGLSLNACGSGAAKVGGLFFISKTTTMDAVRWIVINELEVYDRARIYIRFTTCVSRVHKFRHNEARFARAMKVSCPSLFRFFPLQKEDKTHDGKWNRAHACITATHTSLTQKMSGRRGLSATDDGKKTLPFQKVVSPIPLISPFLFAADSTFVSDSSSCATSSEQQEDPALGSQQKSSKFPARWAFAYMRGIYTQCFRAALGATIGRQRIGFLGSL